ncbi:anti-sigma factor [Devosia sp.]|uniref:anti-sigma factor family protein n=1 Tax=Devosia sp. TaxID=1871048 RepID=UPI003262F6EC
MSLPVTHNVLMAYADGRLPPEQIAAVEAHLAANPDAAAEVALWQRQRDAITTLFAPVAAEPVPARLRAARIAAEQNRRSGMNFRWAAAAVVLVGLGIGAGWFVRPLIDRAPSASDILIASAVNAHTVFVGEKRHAVEVWAKEQDHLVSWLSARLDTKIGTPDLAPEGFQLVGGRLLPGDPKTGRAAQLMYENAAAERVTIYITDALPDHASAYQFAAINQTDAFYWANAFITCTVVGSLPDEQMKTVSQSIYRQLTALDEGETPTYHG